MGILLIEINFQGCILNLILRELSLLIIGKEKKYAPLSLELVCPLLEDVRASTIEFKSGHPYAI